jgi:hypothetical protein
MKPRVYVLHLGGDRSDDTFQVRFKVGNQTFDIGTAWFTNDEARHHARMFRRALKTAAEQTAPPMWSGPYNNIL